MTITDLPEGSFTNPVWTALHSVHSRFAIPAASLVGESRTNEACRYPEDVVPFVSIAAPALSAMRQVHGLLGPGESVWLIGAQYVEIPELRREATLECFQMVLPEDVVAAESPVKILPLTDAHAHEMVALTEVAFPGFFRRRTCEMGSYFGVRSPAGQLIAMGGERLKLDGFSEISAVCTHPDFRGHAYGTHIIWEIVRMHRRQGVASFLHVGCANTRAVELYLRMGFKNIRKVTLHRISARDTGS
jgi:ribosomal protein S18 acetylase RimI-like enzyme